MTIVFVCNILMEALAMIFCLHYLYGEKNYFNKITIIYLVVDTLLMVMMNVLHVHSEWSLIMLLLIVLYSGFKFGFKLRKLIINNILQVIIVSGLQALCMMIYAIIVGNQKLEPKDILIINVSVFLIILFGIKKCRLEKISEALQKNDKLVITSLIMVIFATSLSILNYKQTLKIEMLYYGVLGISILLIVITAIDIGKSKIKVKEAEAELRLHKLYEASFQELIDEIRAKQHEFNNHINTIYSQHRIYKTYDELVEAQQKYCDVVVEDNRFNGVLSKGNPVILCFLCSEFSKMKKAGIEIDYDINIGDLECNMPVYKMVELLGNLINNAMEASFNNSKKVSVMMSENMHMIQIEVFNEHELIDEKKIKDYFKKGYSEKGKNRGYGLYNLRKICEEYDAAISCKNENRNGKNGILFRVIVNKPL